MPKRILVVDDDPIVRGVLSSGLKKGGYEVEAVGLGREAVKKATEKRPDLIILDIMLPDIDGTEVAQILKENMITVNIPIIYLTGLKEGKDDSLDSNTDTGSVIFGKPFDPKVIMAKIQEMTQ